MFLLLSPMRGSHLRVSRIVVTCHRVASVCVYVCVCVSLWGVLHWAYLTLSPSAPFQSHKLMWLPRYCSLGMQIKFCEEMFCYGCFPQQKYSFNHHWYSSAMNILHVLTPTFHNSKVRLWILYVRPCFFLFFLYICVQDCVKACKNNFVNHSFCHVFQYKSFQHS